MKKNKKVKLSIDDLQVKSFSATLRKEQSGNIKGGDDTTFCTYLTIWGCGPQGSGDSGTGASQTACMACCGETNYPPCNTN